MSRLGIDIDGVIADFCLAYGQLIIETTGECLFPVNWKQRLAEGTFPKVWNWEKAAGYSPEVIEKVWKRGILSSPTFWEKLVPYAGAKEALFNLNRYAKAGDELYFITNRAGYKAKKQTETWLYNHGIDFPTVIISGNKTPIVDGLGLDFFIDDRAETIIDVARWALAEKRSLHLFIKKMPYNEGVYPSNVKAADSLTAALKEVQMWRP